MGGTYLFLLRIDYTTGQLDVMRTTFYSITGVDPAHAAADLPGVAAHSAGTDTYRSPCVTPFLPGLFHFHLPLHYLPTAATAQPDDVLLALDAFADTLLTYFLVGRPVYRQFYEHGWLKHRLLPHIPHHHAPEHYSPITCTVGRLNAARKTFTLRSVPFFTYTRFLDMTNYRTPGRGSGLDSVTPRWPSGVDGLDFTGWTRRNAYYHMDVLLPIPLQFTTLNGVVISRRTFSSGSTTYPYDVVVWFDKTRYHYHWL